MTIIKYFSDLSDEFSKNSDPLLAERSRAYMRNKSDFYGLTSPIRKQIVRAFLSKNGYPHYNQLEDMIHYAWEQPQREWQYTAMEITTKFVNKADQQLIDISEWMITHKSWWDSVDYIAPNIAGMLFKKYPEVKMQYIENWMMSENLWLQRSCLIHQLRFNNSADRALLFNLCERLAMHPDFFIRKAIGWSLRQYSKAFPDAVIDFVNNHELSNLSRKEALKLINRK